MEKFIVKLQTTTVGGPCTLVYNEDRSVFFQEEKIRPEIRRITGHSKRKTMTKGYFFARIEDGEIVIGKRAPRQNW